MVVMQAGAYSYSLPASDQKALIGPLLHGRGILIMWLTLWCLCKHHTINGHAARHATILMHQSV